MKKSILFFVAFCLLFENPVNAQIGRLLNKVSKSASKDVVKEPEEGSNKKHSDQPEPACACSDAVVIMDMGGKLKLDYEELSLSILDDGSILAKTRGNGEYYIVKDGVTQGPYKSGDPQIAVFEAMDENNKTIEGFILRNKPYISKSGDKLLITFQ